MKSSTFFHAAVTPVALILPVSNTQSIAKHFNSPYALRIHTSRPNLNNALIQPSRGDNAGLFAEPSSSAPPWQFQTFPGYEMFNDTYQLILLGEKVFMWDLEPASMQMSAVPKAVAKTGWPGSQWPSVYISAKWDFNVTKDGKTGKWWMEHGFDHGEWIAQPVELVGDDRWSVLWWNGRFFKAFTLPVLFD